MTVDAVCRTCGGSGTLRDRPGYVASYWDDDHGWHQWHYCFVDDRGYATKSVEFSRPAYGPKDFQRVDSTTGDCHGCDGTGKEQE